MLVQSEPGLLAAFFTDISKAVMALHWYLFDWCYEMPGVSVRKLGIDQGIGVIRNVKMRHARPIK